MVDPVVVFIELGLRLDQSKQRSGLIRESNYWQDRLACRPLSLNPILDVSGFTVAIAVSVGNAALISIGIVRTLSDEDLIVQW